jgi:two-component system NtrC family sensor kinase
MKGTVLIVDDSLTVRMDLAEAFREAGIEPVLCSSVAEARDALSRNRADVVILDILLPDGDGIELLKEIRAARSGSDPAVVMLSSEAEVKDRIRGLQTGANEYVGKPYDSGYVVAKTQELLRGRLLSSSSVPTVLVIDDSATFREELRMALEEAGYPVLTASSGEEGLRLAASQRPAAVLVDGVLPGIDGATVIRRIRLDAALRDVPCLLLTASDDMDTELRALDAGADSFVRKEDHCDVILVRLAAVLRRASTRTPSEETRSLLAPKTILTVDDSPTYLDELGGALREEGYDVIPARSGEEAIELLAVQTVDCILLDLLMPGLSGHDTCHRIKAAPSVRDVPLIMLTALEDRNAMIEGLSAGADDYISKSTEFEVLKARVRAQIRRKQFEDENRRIREELLRTELDATEARAARELAETRATLVEELERKNAELKAANRELDAFSFSVSHDLRSPLRAVSGFSGILVRDHAAEMSLEAQRLLQKVSSAAQQMDQLIEDLLRFARLGRQQLSKQLVPLGQLVQDVLAELAKEHSEREVEIRVSDLPEIVADPPLLKQVFTNLLSNAFKFSRDRDRAMIEVECRRYKGDHVFSIRDNGAGFDMKYAAKLFGVFQRLHTQDQFAGTGVGLSLVQRIITRHGGRIWAEGEVGKGATFHFSLPDVSLSPTLSTGGSGGVTTPLQLGMGRRVLVVDDDPLFCKLASRRLRDAGFVVDTAGTAEAALTMAAAAPPPNAILLAIQMPGMDGFQLRQAMRADTALARIPIILVSSALVDEKAPKGGGTPDAHGVVRSPDLREAIAALLAALDELPHGTP